MKEKLCSKCGEPFPVIEPGDDPTELDQGTAYLEAASEVCISCHTGWPHVWTRTQSPSMQFLPAAPMMTPQRLAELNREAEKWLERKGYRRPAAVPSTKATWVDVPPLLILLGLQLAQALARALARAAKKCLGRSANKAKKLKDRSANKIKAEKEAELLDLQLEEARRRAKEARRQ